MTDPDQTLLALLRATPNFLLFCLILLPRRTTRTIETGSPPRTTSCLVLSVRRCPDGVAALCGHEYSPAPLRLSGRAKGTQRPDIGRGAAGDDRSGDPGVST